MARNKRPVPIAPPKSTVVTPYLVDNTEGGMHLTVSKEGTVSLWDLPGFRVIGETTLHLALTPSQRQQILDAAKEAGR